jgi:hypothetical protein
LLGQRDLDDISILEQDWPFNQFTVAMCAVFAVQIFQLDAIGCVDQTSMYARNLSAGNHNIAGILAPNHQAGINHKPLTVQGAALGDQDWIFFRALKHTLTY